MHQMFGYFSHRPAKYDWRVLHHLLLQQSYSHPLLTNTWYRLQNYHFLQDQRSPSPLRPLWHLHIAQAVPPLLPSLPVLHQIPDALHRYKIHLISLKISYRCQKQEDSSLPLRSCRRRPCQALASHFSKYNLSAPERVQSHRDPGTENHTIFRLPYQSRHPVPLRRLLHCSGN